jgi:hypothetical protein
MLQQTLQQHNYNPLAEGGLTDLECANALGIKTSLCNTPQFNGAAIDKVYAQNLEVEFQEALDRGLSLTEAKRIAKAVADQGKQETLDRLASRKKRTGKDWA